MGGAGVGAASAAQEQETGVRVWLSRERVPEGLWSST